MGSVMTNIYDGLDEYNDTFKPIPLQQVLPPMFDRIWQWNDIANVEPSETTMKLYKKLITEEYNEFIDAFDQNQALDFKSPVYETEELDACIDMMWVIVGYMRSRGWSKETVFAAIEEVERSNYSKFVETEDGYRCVKREDGKILKPDTFSPADIAAIIQQSYLEE